MDDDLALTHEQPDLVEVVVRDVGDHLLSALSRSPGRASAGAGHAESASGGDPTPVAARNFLLLVSVISCLPMTRGSV